MIELIKPHKILFIKLGEGGKFEKECIENQILKLGYRKVDHKICLEKKWHEVHDYFTSQEQSKTFVATSHTNQIKQFYLENENTLWITFYLNKLWWCFSKPEIGLLPDNSKIRKVIGKWSDKDISGKLLLSSNISGKLLKTQGFRGTICKVIESNYALAKINCELSNEIIEVENAMNVLKIKLIDLIKKLQWKDFETLIDLIFRQAGWQRVGDTGKTQKTLDLELFAPVTGERSIVQIKSQSNLKEFIEYQNNFIAMNDYHRFFYVVHTATKSLQDYKLESNMNIHLYLDFKISELTIASGLVEWVIKKAS